MKNFPLRVGGGAEREREMKERGISFSDFDVPNSLQTREKEMSTVVPQMKFATPADPPAPRIRENPAVARFSLAGR